MFSSTKRLIFTLVMGAVVLNSCVKEITDDLDDLQTADDTQDWIFPFINSDIQLEDLDSNNIKVYPDGTVYYTSVVDSIMNINIDDIFVLPSNQQLSVQNFSFSGVNTAAYSENLDVALQNVLSNDFSVWSMLAPINNSTSTVPAFSANNLGYQIMPTFTSFEYITYDNGLLDVTFTNSSNIPLSNITLELSNVFTGEVLGTVFYPLVDPGNNATQQIGMVGKTIRSLIRYRVQSMSSPGVSTPIAVDFSMPFNVEISSTDAMEVNLANATFNNPIFDFTFFYELKDNLGAPLDQEITKIKIKSGTLQYLISTPALSTAINLETEALGSNHIDSGTFKFENQIPGLVPYSISKTKDLAGYSFDLTQDPFNPFNRVPLKFQPSHIFPNLNKFNKNDNLSISVLLQDIEFEYVIGRFGTDTITIPQHTVDWQDDDIFSNISGNMQTKGARINFLSKTNIGADYSADLLGYVQDVNQVPFSINFNQQLELIGPTTPEFGTTVFDVFSYDETNSNSDDVISSFPYSMTTAGTMYLNANNPNRECYYNDEAFMQIDVELETPFHLYADSVFYIDTVSYENEDFDDIRDMDTAKFVNSVFLHMYIENDFPVGIGTSISIIDSIDATTDSLLREIDYDGVIQGAKVDANGVTIQPTKYKHIIELSKDDRIALVNGDKVLVNIKLLTSKYNATTPFVRLKDDDHFKLNLSVEIQNHIPVE